MEYYSIINYSILSVKNANNMDVQQMHICKSESNSSMIIGYLSILTLMSCEIFIIYFHI